jgi:hypothetical protein
MLTPTCIGVGIALPMTNSIWACLLSSQVIEASDKSMKHEPLNMKTSKFQPYFTGKPLVRIEYSYNETTMFCRIGGDLTSTPINAEQLSELNSLHANEQMRAAAIFASSI